MAAAVKRILTDFEELLEKRTWVYVFVGVVERVWVVGFERMDDRSQAS